MPDPTKENNHLVKNVADIFSRLFLSFTYLLKFGLWHLIFYTFLISPVQSYALTNWYKYPGNPVFQPGKEGDWDEYLFDFDIIFENNEYRMWYLGFRKDGPTMNSFGHARSPDGIHWEKYKGNPLTFNSDSIIWGNSFSTFDIIRKDSMYLMWYSAKPTDSSLSLCIGFAWSTDGLKWNNHPKPVLIPGNGDAWDGNGVANPIVFFDGQIFHMWFSGWPNQIPKTVFTGYATSPDGINWKKHNSNPVLTTGEPGSWDDQWLVGYSVTYNRSQFEMWYFGWDLIKFEIGLATSADGIHWNKSNENPILKSGALGAWDAVLIAPRVLNHDSIYRMWYCGFYNINGTYGYATNSFSEVNNWNKAEIETQQRLIRIQVFNRLEYINVDSLLSNLQALSGNELIDAYNKLALAYSLNDEALSYKYAGKALEKASKDCYPKGKALALYSMGNSQYVLNNYSKALANQLTALRIFDSLGMLSEKGNLLSQIASIHTYAGSYDLACKYHQESLNAFTRIMDTNAVLNTLNYLGEAYLDAGDTIHAMETFDREFILAKSINNPYNEGLAYEGKGRCFTGRSLDSSIYYLERANGIWKNNRLLEAAINSLLIAETYLAFGPEYINMAEESLKKSSYLLLLTISDGQHQLKWLYLMSELNIATKRYKKAREYLDQSLEMCQKYISKQDQLQHVSLNHKLEFGIFLKEYMEKIYRLYYEFDVLTQDKDGALQHFVLATSWSDSVSNDHAWKKVAIIQGEYETETAKSRISILEKDNEVKNLTIKQTRNYIISIAGLVVIIILIAMFIIRQKKIKDEHRTAIREQKYQHTVEIKQLESEKLKELDHLRSRFFANISHEFRTPLTLILGPLEKLLSNTKNTSEIKELNIAKKYAGRLQTLINQLLTISKLESGKMQLHASETDIVKMVRGYLQAYESLAKQKNIKLTFSANVEEIKVYFDKEKIEQILNNLLSNAFKFTESGGEIVVEISSPQSAVGSQQSTKFHNLTEDRRLKTEDRRLKTEDWRLKTGDWRLKTEDLAGQWVSISISDTGHGISPEHINHIFNRFYQVEHTDGSYFEGTGIGLALTKELVELHQGTIKVDSEQGKGSVFTIFLPLGKDHLKSEEISDDKPEKVSSQLFPESLLDIEKDEILVSGSTTEDNDSQSILLIVEDNADMRDYIREYFETSFRIIEAVDGLDGFEKSVEHIPDIIISDIMMPKMDGTELCRKVKTDERTSHIPLILLTARASKKDRIESLETGADDFITKPFDGDEIQVRVENLIHQRRKLQEHYLKNIEATDETLSLEEKFLQRATNVATENFSNPAYSVEDFASDMALSRNQLHRKLRALVNNSCTEFIRTIRLNRAVELLRKRSGNISEVAYDTGFNNPTYFSIAFKEKFGMSPSDYQKNA